MGHICLYTGDMQNKLKFEDLMSIAETLLGVAAVELERTVCVFRAEASLAAPFARVCGADLFSDPVEQAFICARELVRNRPFLEGNREIAYMAMREMLLLSRYGWLPRSDDRKEIPKKMKQLERREISDAAFLRWVRSRVRTLSELEAEATA
jgi:prophage maintenance system killer protein